MKRPSDVIASLFGLVVFAPLLAVVRVLVRHKLGKPCFFAQKRPGRNAVPFSMIKFRSMRDGTDENGNPLGDAPRITSFGKKLRATSVDELPGLWNVLKGEMSLVGSRPLLMEYVPLYSTQQPRRMDVRPGITGWAQVNRRNSLSWEDKFALDVWYVDNRTFWLGLKVIG